MIAFLILALLMLLPQFSTRVDLVEVYASVSRPTGAPVEDLTAEDFVVSENGVERRIQTFVRGEFALTVVLALDRSLSMEGRPLRLAREAARLFLDQLRPEDRAVIVAISTNVEVMGDLSHDRDEQYAALNALIAEGTTRLHDAIVLVANGLNRIGGRRAMIVLSDGEDRISGAKPADVVARIRQSDVLVYGVTLARRPALLFEELAVLSGGRSFHITKPQQLAGVFSTIARELRAQYLLGYAPPAGPPGWRTIQVRVNKPGVNVRARSGYVAR